MQSLMYLRGRRLWVVPDFLVRGSGSDGEFYYLGLEFVDSAGRLMFGRTVIGDAAQNVSFTELEDWKGNNLPATISSPRILISSRSQYNAFLVGEESNNGFRIARDPLAPGPVQVDLFVYEMGE